MTVGELANHTKRNDPTSFRETLFYNRRLPDKRWGWQKKTRSASDFCRADVNANNRATYRMGLLRPRTHIPMDSVPIILNISVNVNIKYIRLFIFYKCVTLSTAPTIYFCPLA